MGHARALLALEDGLQVDAARQVASKGLSVRETEALVRRFSQPKVSEPRMQEEQDPNVRRLLSDLTEKLGAKVALQQAAGGKGRLVISYNSLDELEGILDHIQ
jgi:ParB family chromosome partitioning protein